MRFIQVQQDDVRPFPGDDGTDPVGHTQDACPADRGHFHDLLSRKNGGIGREDLVEFCAHPHLAEEVKVVVAGTAVGSQPDVDSPAEHRRNGGDAGAELHVALRIVGHLNAECREDVEFILFQPDAMGGDGSLVEKIKVVQMMDGLLSVSFPE